MILSDMSAWDNAEQGGLDDDRRASAAPQRRLQASAGRRPRAATLIQLDGINKVFFTDEVETHALAGIHLEIAQRRVRLDRRPVRLRQDDAALDPRPARHADRRRATLLAGEPVADLSAVRARAHPQPADRLHLPGVQPDRRPHGLRERRAAAHLPRHAGRRAQEARAGGARARRHGAPHEALPGAALRRSAAARRRGPRRRRRSARSSSPTSRPATSTRRTARR